MHVWLEVHVDDVMLAENPSCWPEVADLVDRVAQLAEREGGRLSFRVRQWFSGGDRHGFLRQLQARGHEVGAHAHGTDLAASVRALAGAGIVSPVMAPGLVQAGAAGRLRLLNQAHGLGARVVTDRLEARYFTYQGWLPSHPLSGLTQLDVSVSPFAWGVLHRKKIGVEPPYGRLDWAELDRCADEQGRWAPPHGQNAYFGATFHEHDLCQRGQLRPIQACLDGLARWVGKWQPKPSILAAIDAPSEGGGSIGKVIGSEATPARSGRTVSSGARIPVTFIPTSWNLGRTPFRPRTLRLGPAHPRAALVVVHAGASGLTERLRFLGLPDSAFPEVALWLYERTPGTPRAPGNPIHLADARTVLAAALEEGVPTVLLSWSGGCVPAARALGDLRRCDPERAQFVRTFVDVEGPVDRLSLVPPNRIGHEWLTASPHDPTQWRDLELVELFGSFAGNQRPPVEYVRLQGTPDHVHGTSLIHAQRALEAAARAQLPTRHWSLTGPLRTESATIHHLLGGLLDELGLS